MGTSQPHPPARVARQDGLVDALAQAAFTTMAALTKVAADSDLSLTQLRVLAILQDRRLRMTALADYLGLEKSTISGLVNRAERRGLLQRLPSASDGRAAEVTLAPQGAELAGQLYARIARALSPMTSRLAAADRRLLQGLLEQMLQVLRSPGLTVARMAPRTVRAGRSRSLRTVSGPSPAC
jgi:DNA-binding MarR family transcriptional regulator